MHGREVHVNEEKSKKKLKYRQNSCFGIGMTIGIEVKKVKTEIKIETNRRMSKSLCCKYGGGIMNQGWKKILEQGQIAQQSK